MTKLTQAIIEYMVKNQVTYDTDIEVPRYTSVFDRNGKEIANIKVDDLLEGLVEQICDLQTQLAHANDILQRLYDLEQEESENK